MLEVDVDHPVVELPKLTYCDFQNIDTVDHTIKYTDFFDNFMWKNLPCVIKNTTLNWKCLRYWIKDNKINYEYFVENYGDFEAPVADCDAISFNAHCKTNMKVHEYMNYLKTDKKEKLLYLKDWHLRKLMPSDIFYEVPVLFASDWLNEFATDHNEDDFMFVYIGPQDSWTPLHADVYNSFSWSVNVIGKKKWVLLPPGEEQKIKDSMGNLPLLFDSTKYENLNYFEVIQEQGDALFVPSGWHHQVINLENTISVNHNWVNGCNLETVWSALESCLSAVENEIQDLKEFPEFASQCQLILKSVFGMDFNDFINFVTHIALKRIKQCRGEITRSFLDFVLGKNHLKFDLQIINKVMDMIQHHYLFFIECIPPNTKTLFISTKQMISELQL